VGCCPSTVSKYHKEVITLHFYFSGVRDQEALDWLTLAGVQRILVDVYDFQRHQESATFSWDGALALDSGAYRLFKKNKRRKKPVEPMPFEQYLAIARSHPFAFIVQQDEVGNPEATAQNWEIARPYTAELPLMPVWQWGGDDGYLRALLDEAPVVGIGGLAPALHDKDEAALSAMTTLAEHYPQRFHVFGLSWPRAITRLAPLLASADSSVWLRPKTKGLVVFRHTQHGYLSHAPARVLGMEHFDIADRCIASAQAIEAFCEEVVA
jgi:hypothetical protein